MHAYLLVGGNEDLLHDKAVDMAKKQKLSFLEFPLNKIEDVRNLNRFTSFSLSKPTAIYIKNIDVATSEALNAFLKNLEEPQEKLVYFLGAATIHNLLPTIISRCQVTKVGNGRLQIKNSHVEDFCKMTLPEKLTFITNIKKRDEAKLFLDSYIYFYHNKLARPNANYPSAVQNLKCALKSMSAIKANGNVLLQLTNFVISVS